MTQTQTKFTSWAAEKSGGRGSWIKDASGQWVALACGDTDEAAERRARLIASAPDLLAALERIANMQAGGPHLSAKDGMSAALASLDRARDIARAAIAAAREG